VRSAGLGLVAAAPDGELQAVGDGVVVAVNEVQGACGFRRG
jgi:hypothetical protein